MTDLSEWLTRIDAVEARLGDVATPAPGLTDADPATGEQWEAGQVWAHLAEFPAYWLAQAQRVVSLPTNEPVPFGRVKTDAARIAAIERDRNTDPEALLQRVRTSLAEVTDAARELPPESWTLRGMHPTRGEMTVEQIFETFIAKHLEEHAEQLDSLERG